MVQLPVDLTSTCVISGFRHEVDENCTLLGCYVASSDNFLRAFRDNLLVPSLGWSLNMGPIGCPKTSVINFQYSLRNNPEEYNGLIINNGSQKTQLYL